MTGKRQKKTSENINARLALVTRSGKYDLGLATGSNENQPFSPPLTEEEKRIIDDSSKSGNWKRWGPYLSERQWATVREDYSPNGDSWNFFPHDHARSRAYRWGEDGILGICDRQCRLCFALCMWNGKDPILKERIFGLTGPEGNHGEDPKELYFYLDSTPTHSYMKGLYKYPQSEYPYKELVEENRRRTRNDPEYELYDTGIFDKNKYWDVFAEYAKATDNDVFIKITVVNRGLDTTLLHLIPTLWYRNTWVWGCTHEGCWMKPRMKPISEFAIETSHESLGKFEFHVEKIPDEWLWTDNETNNKKLWGCDNHSNYTKDAFHEYIIHGNKEAINPRQRGTKVGFYYKLTLKPGEAQSLRFRLVSQTDNVLYPRDPTAFEHFDDIFNLRIKEANDFYRKIIPATLTAEERNVCRQAFAGLLWSKQFYHYIVKAWLEGDPDQPKPPPSRYLGRNVDWMHLFNRDVISMPDKWEYPWYASWDLAFHMVPLCMIDPPFAKDQLVLFLREWYMHPNGMIPAYEFNLSDVNPPVHAWATWKVYKLTGKNDLLFLMRVFQKLLLNFTWWVNRKDSEGKHIFSGGFLGLDNISIFDRSTTKNLEQADATSWMAFFCACMLKISIELAHYYPAMEDIASKFFEHFVAIVDAMNTLGGTGLWDEQDGFYYDQLKVGSERIPLRIRSMVGLIPLLAVNVIKTEDIDKLSGFKRRMDWFLQNRTDLSRHISWMNKSDSKMGEASHYLLAVPSKERLIRVLHYLFKEDEFLSPYGIRSLSKYYEKNPYIFQDGDRVYEVRYLPGESNIDLFGGNSNWRGPIWFPVNCLLIESLQRFYRYYGETLQIEYPTGSGIKMSLNKIAKDLKRRLASLFLPSPLTGFRPCHGDNKHFGTDPHWKNLLLFHEYFHADTGKGLGAEHQTGWTGLIAAVLVTLGRGRKRQHTKDHEYHRHHKIRISASEDLHEDHDHEKHHRHHHADAKPQEQENDRETKTKVKTQQENVE